ncbi:MAG: tRNA pseudouridine(38-40) synthase TruA [Firmicutes bacterium]|nr:tRNA pseudouridine(38-40) synthase TruA [Bacillota bacterium]
MTEPEKEKNILLTIAYDGTNFSGWQRQPGSRTVCGVLEEQLSDLLGCPVKLDGTSRTDAGVHALGQRASFKAVCPVPTEKLAKVLNDRLAKDRLEGVSDLRVLNAREMPEGFHARFSSRGKRYIYRILNSPDRDIFKRNYFYQISESLDLEAMRAAAAHVVGEHDFACFMSSGSTPQESTVRNVYRLDVDELPAEGPGNSREIRITIEGSGFLYNMVRIITGTLVEAGKGRRSPESVREAIESKDRSKAGHTAPPQGLYLAEIFYGEDAEAPASAGE